MKTVLFMAMSANGMIADTAGSEEFLSDVHWKTFTERAEKHGNLMYGRKAFEAVQSWGETYSLSRLTNVVKVVITHDNSYELPDGYVRADSPEDALVLLKEKGIETALIAGGASIMSAFAKVGFIDEIILTIEPAVLGKGIPLFKPDDFTLTLELIGTNVLEEGIVQLHYKVLQ